MTLLDQLAATVRAGKGIMLSNSGNIKSEVDSMTQKTAGDYFPTKYLRAADIQGDMPVTIAKVEEAIMGDDTKPVAFFTELDKGLVMNKTNCLHIAQLLGSEVFTEWTGKKIVLYQMPVQFKGEIMQAIRVKAAGEKPAAQDSLIERGEDDGEPFNPSHEAGGCV